MTTIQEKANDLFLNTEILAPMVRASTTPLRILALNYGADLVYTEEIIDRAITSTDRIINNDLNTIDYVKKMSSFSPKVQRRMKNKGETQPVVLRIVPSIERGKLIYQMGTGESNLALPAATMVANDVDGIDINMGCPKKFSVSGGMGSALLSDLPRACDIIKTLRRNLNIPVSCKIRLLEDDKKTVDFITGLVNAGANAVTIHGRMVGDESTTSARLDRLVETVRLVKSTGSINVPIIINGDLFTRNDMINLRKKSGADGVMLARPALYNTSIFRKPPEEEETNQNNESEENEEGETRYGYESPLLLTKTQVVQDYLTQSIKYKTHYKNVKYVVCEMLSNRRNPGKLTPFMPQNYPGKQTIDKVCKCKCIDALCKLWDVDTSAVAGSNSTSVSATGTKEVLTNNDEKGESTTLHRYDDRYFLDPESLHKERAAEERAKDNGDRVRKCVDTSLVEEKKSLDGQDDDDNELQTKKQKIS